VIAAAGDIACPSTNPVTPVTCHQAQTSDLLLELDPDAVLPLGDNQYEDGSLANFQASYDPTWGRVKDISHPTPGNVEYMTPDAAGYYAYFGEAAGDPTTGWYSFDLGSWHLISLNGLCLSGCREGRPQYEWLSEDLEQSEATCTLAYWHQPRFSSHPEGGDEQYAPFWSLLYSHGVEVVLHGQHHVYERFAPQDPQGRADPGAGIRQFTVGTGGYSLGTFADPVPNSEVRNADTFGVLALTLHDGSYDWEFVPEAGSSFTDAGTGACH
jgi:Calcineurin-like phosphoesterase